MGLIFLVLVLALLFAGFGFAVHLLWVVSAIMFVFWVAGYAFSKGSRRGSRR